MDNLFNVNQAAFILKVHPLTIRRYIKEGRLKALKVGGAIRIKEKDLQEFNKDYTPQAKNTEPGASGMRVKLNPAKSFSMEDPFLRLNGRGASIKLSNV
jgi:excisionase family DNA binding protein